jgi:PAS domain S-box-containing protein
VSADVSSFSFLQYLTTVLDNIGDSVLLIGVESNGRFKLLITNKRFGQSSGYPRDSVGKYIDEIVSPESYGKVAQRYRDAVRHKQPLSYSEWVDVPSGRRAYEVKMIPILDSVGECQQLVAITREVSSAILTSQKLKETSALLQACAQTMGEIVLLTDIFGVIQFEHAPYETDHVGRHISELIPIELPEQGSTSTNIIEQIGSLTGPWVCTVHRSKDSDYCIYTASLQA